MFAFSCHGGVGVNCLAASSGNSFASLVSLARPSPAGRPLAAPQKALLESIQAKQEGCSIMW